jgi:hypothetical protein
VTALARDANKGEAFDTAHRRCNAAARALAGEAAIDDTDDPSTLSVSPMLSPWR